MIILKGWWRRTTSAWIAHITCPPIAGMNASWRSIWRSSKHFATLPVRLIDPLIGIFMRRKPVLIRFVTDLIDEDSRCAAGVFAAAYKLRDDGPLRTEEQEELRELLAWF